MRPYRVHIAEVDNKLRRALRTVLRRCGFEVVESDSGYPIVTMRDDWPDIFLIDIQLPGINGLEVCRWLKSNESSRHIPVIFLSGEPYLKILAASVPADGYFEKPVSLLRLAQRLRRFLTGSMKNRPDTAGRNSPR